MSRAIAPRYPWDEFIEHPDVRAAAYAYCDSQMRFVVNLAHLADNVGVTSRTMYRWRDAGGIPEPAAERILARLGVWPGEVWPNTYAALAAA